MLSSSRRPRRAVSAGEMRPRRSRSVGTIPSATTWTARSEEHTSELQSRGHLVCRLLLEKKKTKWAQWWSSKMGTRKRKTTDSSTSEVNTVTELEMTPTRCMKLSVADSLDT